MSSEIFTSPQGLALLFAAVVTIPCGFAAASMVELHEDAVTCSTAAVEWQLGNADGGAFRASEAANFGERYNVFRTACPNGHIQVDEANIPSAVKASYAPAKK